MLTSVIEKRVRIYLNAIKFIFGLTENYFTNNLTEMCMIPIYRDFGNAIRFLVFTSHHPGNTFAGVSEDYEKEKY